MKNLRIGTRLGGGFVLILVVMTLITAVGLWRLQSVAQATRDMAQQPLALERMISDWYRYVYSGARRTTAIVKSSDPSLGQFFAADAASSTKESVELQKRIEPLLSSPEERALWDEIQQGRTAYLAGRDQSVKAKSEGRLEDAERVFQQDYLPATDRYLGLIQKLLEMQRTRIDATATHIDEIYSEGRLLMLGLGLLGLLAGGLFAWRLTVGITRPLAEAVRVARAVAASDLTSLVRVDTSDETGQLLRALQDMNGSLAQVVARVRTGTDSIATASSEIDAGNQDLSSRTEEQASSLQETAASMEQLTSTVRQNADNARQANQLANSASKTAEQGGRVVAGVVSTMGAINDSSRKIADIIGVIDGIAFQTNILALNAAVEAARAGEQGRGFAVVAGEVRALAQRSAAAAKDIKDLIGDSVARVEEGTGQVAEAGRTMEAIVQSVQRVSDLVAEISAASQEQSQGIEQVHQAISQMDTVTQQNAALVEEAAAATGSLKSQADQLTSAVSVFRIEGGTAAPASSPVLAPRRPAPVARPPVARSPVARSPVARPTAARVASPPAKPAVAAPARAAARPAAAPAHRLAAPAPRQPVAAGHEDEWESF